jgi:hypothetical protein
MARGPCTWLFGGHDEVNLFKHTRLNESTALPLMGEAKMLPPTQPWSIGNETFTTTDSSFIRNSAERAAPHSATSRAVP